MAKLPEQQRLLAEDFQSQRSWIDKLIYPINQFMSSVWNALNKGLTFKENISSDMKEISIKSTDLPYTFSHNIKGRVDSILVLKAKYDPNRNGTNPEDPLTSGLNVEFYDNGKGQVVITRIGGLLSNNRFYSIKLLMLPE